ncbi:hypothetical protein Q8F55_002725 [Vanrija albida]|uniref:SMP domain-containing protein n=1 Tax=Vanrija albida TaxID=181172 RepID=A0ABR3QAK4_9TREE
MGVGAMRNTLDKIDSQGKDTSTASTVKNFLNPFKDSSDNTNDPTRSGMGHADRQSDLRSNPNANVGHTSTGVAGTGVGAGAIAGAKNTMDPNVNTRGTGHTGVGHSSMGSNTMGHNTVGHNTMGHTGVGHNTVGHNTMGTNTMNRNVEAGNHTAGPHTSTGLAGTGLGAGTAADIKNKMDSNVDSSTGRYNTGATGGLGHSGNQHNHGRDAAVVGGAAGLGAGAGAMHHHNRNVEGGNHTAGPHTSTGLGGTGFGAGTAADVKNMTDSNVDSSTGRYNTGATSATGGLGGHHGHHSNTHGVSARHVEGGNHTAGPHTSTGLGGTGFGAGTAADFKNMTDSNVDSSTGRYNTGTTGGLGGHHGNTHGVSARHVEGGNHTAGPHTSTGLGGTGFGAGTAADVKNMKDSNVDSSTGRYNTGTTGPTGGIGGGGNTHSPTDSNIQGGKNTVGPHTSTGLLGTGVGAGAMADIKNKLDSNVDTTTGRNTSTTSSTTGHSQHNYGRDAAVAGGAAGLGAGAVHHSQNRNLEAGNHTAGPHTSTGLAGTGLGAGTAADMKNATDPNVNSRSGFAGSPPRTHGHVPRSPTSGTSGVNDAASRRMLEKGDAPLSAEMGRDPITGAKLQEGSTLSRVADQAAGNTGVHGRSSLDGSRADPATAATLGAGAVAADRRHAGDSQDVRSLGNKLEATRLDERDGSHTGRNAALGAGAGAAVGAGAMHLHNKNSNDPVASGMGHPDRQSALRSNPNAGVGHTGSGLTGSGLQDKNERGGQRTAGPHTSTGLAGTGIGAGMAADIKNKMDSNVDAKTGRTTDSSLGHGRVGDNHHTGRDAHLTGGVGALATPAGQNGREVDRSAAPLSTGARADHTSGPIMSGMSGANAAQHDAAMPTDRGHHSAGIAPGERSTTGRNAALGAGAGALAGGTLASSDRNRLENDSTHNASTTALAGSPTRTHAMGSGVHTSGAAPAPHRGSNVHTGDRTAGPHTSTGIAGTGVGASAAADIKNKMDSDVDSTTGRTKVDSSTRRGDGPGDPIHPRDPRGPHESAHTGTTGVTGATTTGATTTGATKDRRDSGDAKTKIPHTSTGLFGTGVGAEAMAKVKNALDPKVDTSAANEAINRNGANAGDNAYAINRNDPNNGTTATTRTTATDDGTVRNRGPGNIDMPANNSAQNPNLFAQAEAHHGDQTRMPGGYTNRANDANKTGANVVVTPVEERSRAF